MWLLAAAAVSHFAMVGYPIGTSPEALSRDVQRLVSDCALIRLHDQHRLCLISDRSGAELWIGLTEEGSVRELETLNPAFRGRGHAKIIVTRDVSKPGWEPFEKTIEAKFAASGTPLIIDLADPREGALFVKDAHLDVDITAFPDEISIHSSEKAYYDSQGKAKVRFAADHFVPTGMFQAGQGNDGPTAHALFAGKILSSELRQNQRGGGGYWWIVVRTFDNAEVNIVADPSQMNAKPTSGSILAGSFWLSARLAQAAAK